MKQRQYNPEVPAKKLKQLMEKHGHTVYRLSQLTGIGAQALHNILKGTYGMTIKSATVLMNHYNVATDWFIYDISEPVLQKRIEQLEKEIEQYKKTSETFRKQMLEMLKPEKEKIKV